MNKTIVIATCLAALPAYASAANSDLETRLDSLTKRVEKAESQAAQARQLARQARRAARPPQRANAFNPALSLILNGLYAHYSQSPDNYSLPGFALSGEAGLEAEGLSLGESEITLAANTDHYWRGQMTLSFGNVNGETVSDIEEAYVETLGLGNGLTFRAGRFLSGLGYLNGKHTHAWNFSDAPLIYRGLFGDQLKQDGLRLAWLLPTERYLEVALEGGNGQAFPAGGSHAGIGDWVAYARTGGDIGDSHSWQFGLSHFRAGNVDNRESSDHTFSGSSTIDGVDMVYKWAPHGNGTERSVVVQGEFFRRHERGELDVGGAGTSAYRGDQNGWYLEGIYKFRRQWRAGLRYDHVGSNNHASTTGLLAAAGLAAEGKSPHRSSVMLEWVPSEFSRVRLQFNRDESTGETDNQTFLQYTQALGSHGAHSY